MDFVRRFKAMIMGLISLTLIILLFNNCSGSSGGKSSETINGHGTFGQTTLLKTEKYTFLNQDYDLKLFKIEGSEGPLYVEYAVACTNDCPLVVISQPYGGIDWSGDPRDLKWTNRPNSETGYMYRDEDGPLYTTNTIGELFFQKMTPAQGISMGALLLPNHINVAVIYNRFYLGGSLKKYVQDHAEAAQALIASQKEIDPSRVAYFGASLGGFVSAYSAVSGKVNVNRLALLTPLLDLTSEWDYVMNQIPQNVTSNASLLLEYQKFFDPYLRRIQIFTDGSPSEKPNAFLPYKVQTLAPKIQVPTLVLHDTWDTVVPFQQAKTFKDLNPSQVQEVWYQHASAINWNTFKKDHSQSGEGLNTEDTFPFYILFLSKGLMPADQPIYLYYDSLKLAQGLGEMKQAQTRAQDVSWLKKQLVEWCETRITFLDYTSTIGVVNGVQMVNGILNNVWNHSVPFDQTCDWIKNNSL